MTRPRLAPKPKQLAPSWLLGDIVQTGSTRWAIRVLNGDHVELEAMSTHPGIWWTTTLANLPDKEATR